MKYMRCLGYDLTECQRCERLSPMIEGEKFIETPPPKPGSQCKNFVRK